MLRWVTWFGAGKGGAGASRGTSQAGSAYVFMQQALLSCCAALVPSGLGGQLQRDANLSCLSTCSCSVHLCQMDA